MLSTTRKALPTASLLAGAALFAAATPAAAQIDADKLSIHGFLTQGFGLSNDHDILGISADHPTSDYRAAALQVRYALTEKDNFVLQLNHRRFGVNPLGEALDDVRVGWAFYQRQVGNGSFKIGKAPVPKGFFNETRFVGTLNPLYRAPVTIYSEGFEALDGAMISQRAALGSDWSVNATAYAGGLSSEDVQRVDVGGGQIYTVVAESRLDRVVGSQVVLETPVEGLRVSVDAMRFKINDMPDGQGGVMTFDWGASMTGSAELVGSRGTLRGEYSRLMYPGYRTGSYYGQGILNVTEQLALVGQAEFQDDELVEDRSQLYRDIAAGVRFSLTPGVVFKLEGHRARGRLFFDSYVAPTGPALETTYGLASVSLSF